jgi:hypothetical protein
VKSESSFAMVARVGSSDIEEELRKRGSLCVAAVRVLPVGGVEGKMGVLRESVDPSIAALEVVSMWLIVEFRRITLRSLILMTRQWLESHP